MAGWKLRKDKSPAETSDDSPTTNETLPIHSPDLSPVDPLTGELRRWEVTGDLSATDEDVQKEISILLEGREHGGSGSALVAEPAGQNPELSLPGPAPEEPTDPAEFREEETSHYAAPLELADTASLQPAPPPVEAEDEEVDADPAPYFDDEEETPLELSNSSSAPAPFVFQAPVIAPATMESISGANDFTSTLRLDRTDLPLPVPPSTGPELNIPTVAPFLLDVPAGEASETTHTLLVRIGRLSATFELTKDITVIGRPDSNLHSYPDVEIDMDDAVSRRHAEIVLHGKEYYLMDAGSTNGTLLNGETLPPNEERLLAHGDRIRVGERTEIIFE